LATIAAAAAIVIYVFIMNSNNSSGGRNPNSDPNSNTKPLRPRRNLNPKPLQPHRTNLNPVSNPTPPLPGPISDMEFKNKFPGLLSPNGENSCFVIDAVNILWNTNLRKEVPQWQIDKNLSPATFAFRELFIANNAKRRFHCIQQLRGTVEGFRGDYSYVSGHQDAIQFLKHLLDTMKKERGLQQDASIPDYGVYGFLEGPIYDTDLVYQLFGRRHPQVLIFDTVSSNVLFKTSEKFTVEKSTYELASISGGTRGHYVPFLRDYQGNGWWISLSFGTREVYKTLADVRKTSDGGHGANDRGAHAYIYVKT